MSEFLHASADNNSSTAVGCTGNKWKGTSINDVGKYVTVQLEKKWVEFNALHPLDFKKFLRKYFDGYKESGETKIGILIMTKNQVQLDAGLNLEKATRLIEQRNEESYY